MEISDLNPKGYPVTQEISDNLEKLLISINALQDECKLPFIVNSGLRTAEDQARINPVVKKSAHMAGQAVDLSDVDGLIYDFCINNIDVLINLGIYVEYRTFTPRWIHLQIRPTVNRFFIP